ncbi:CHAT domain-containing protein [Flammula alnicola]|nr:CHAT domain-containing protein [Flammula alnicola]
MRGVTLMPPITNSRNNSSNAQNPMDEDLVASSPRTQKRETQTSITQDRKIYMASKDFDHKAFAHTFSSSSDVVIECLQAGAEHSVLDTLEIRVDDRVAENTGALRLEKVSQTKWKYKDTIDLAVNADGFKLVAQSKEAGDIGHIYLTRAELGDWTTRAPLHEKITRQLVTEGEKPTLTLSFEILFIPSDNTNVLRDRDQPSEAAVADELELQFTQISTLPDDNPEKPRVLKECGDRFLLRFRRTRNEQDFDKSIVAFERALQLARTADPKLVNFMHTSGIIYQERYDAGGMLCDIDRTISLFKYVAQGTPDAHPDIGDRLHILGNALSRRFERTQDPTDISEAISAHQKALRLTPEVHANRPRFLDSLGNALRRRFERMGDLHDISEAVLTHQKSVDLTPEGHPDMPGRLSSLGRAFSSRFERNGNLSDISEALSAHQTAVRLTPEGHELVPRRLNGLGNSFLSRFERTGDLSDIAEAISVFQRAVQLTPQDHAEMPELLNSLGNSFFRRFDHKGSLSDIAEAMTIYQKAVRLTPEGDANMPRWLNNVGIAFRRRFELTGDLKDLNEAISAQQKAVQLAPKDHANTPRWLNSLGNSFLIRFQRTGDLDDISKAISTHQTAVRLTPEDHANMPVQLNSLGNSYFRRFERTGDLADISEAISAHRKAVNLTPERHDDKPLWLNNLGNSLRHRFIRTGNLTDLSEAISAQQKSVHLTPEGHANLPLRLNSLGISFLRRFKRTGDVSDISEAISAHQKAVHLTPEGHAIMAVRLNSLGISFLSRFECTKDISDISDGISALQKSIRLTPKGHPNIPIQLNNLGTSLQRRFERLEDVNDISEAISIFQQAVHLTPAGHAYMPGFLNNLGYSFRRRFERTGDLADISEAISAQQKAIQLTPEGHASAPGRLNSLGNSFISRFKQTGNPTDVAAANSNYRLAALAVTGPPSLHLHAAQTWAEQSQTIDPPQALEAFTRAIELLSQVAGMEQTIQKRHRNLVDISDLSTAAAAFATSHGRYNKALEWLEHGRCLVWNQINNLRTPLDALRSHNRALADDLSRKMSLQDEVNAHVQLAQEWEQLLARVRAIPEFEDFVRPPKCSNILKHIPNSGPVIIINVHGDRCDALALTSGADTPLHVPLQGFSYGKAQKLRDDLYQYILGRGIRNRGFESDMRGMQRMSRPNSGIYKILRDLWNLVVKPVLDVLSISMENPPSDPTRIWWCATGPLTFLPIHAAGLYGQKDTKLGSCLSDFAISSYIPTVSTLLERVKNLRKSDETSPRLLLISVPSTPKFPNLGRIPGTTREVEAIQQRLERGAFHSLSLGGDSATIGQVMQEMESHSFVHFACHAAQDLENPLESGFYLHDGQLKLSDIIKKEIPNSDLAFLSACQTGTGDVKLSEEAVHLAAGMLAAGYHGVVATMWSIMDRHGPKIAEDFYGHLIKQGVRDTGESEELSSVRGAHALHHATQQIRKSLGDSESSLLVWIPYVHFGL